MCEYVKENMCLITNDVCPFMYYCDKRSAWMPNKNMPKSCKQKQAQEIPKGCYPVREERKGYLYVDVNNQTLKFLNPFENIPLYVKLTKSKDGTYRIKKS